MLLIFERKILRASEKKPSFDCALVFSKGPSCSMKSMLIKFKLSAYQTNFRTKIDFSGPKVPLLEITQYANQTM